MGGRGGFPAHVALLVACAALLVAGAMHDNLWFDEAYSVALAAHSAPELLRIAATDVHPPLYYLMLRVVWLLAGGRVWALRLLSVSGAIAVAALGLTHVAPRHGRAAAPAALACASCAAGACAGVVVVNRYAAMFTTETNLLLVGAYDYERLVAFTSSASYVMGALFLALGCALLVATWRVVCSVDAERLMEGVRVTPEQRLRAFLVSRGLSDLQAEVTLLTAEGLSARQIGARLHYAPGTVSAARVGAYRALGVHDRAQLVAVLSGAGG